MIRVLEPVIPPCREITFDSAPETRVLEPEIPPCSAITLDSAPEIRVLEPVIPLCKFIMFVLDPDKPPDIVKKVA